MQMMFDHTFGKQEQQDLVVAKPMCIFEREEEQGAIDHGWLALDEPVHGREVFYQSRSTRINMRKWRPRFREHKLNGKHIEYKIIDASDMVRLLGLPHIYEQYMKRKKFGADYTPFRHHHNRDRFMVFYTGTADNIVAFTKQKLYIAEDPHYSQIGDPYVEYAGVESCIHANTAPIGALTLDLELKWASEHQVPFYYTGSGYERSSEYKSSWRGFEWWTGVEWTNNRRLYKRLCGRDSKLTRFSELGNLSLIPDKR